MLCCAGVGDRPICLASAGGILVHLLPDQSVNIGGFARTFFLNSESEKISTMRIAQDLYCG